MKINGFCFGTGLVLGLGMLWQFNHGNLFYGMIMMLLSILNFSLAFKNE